jgi:hypothetical protein
MRPRPIAALAATQFAALKPPAIEGTRPGSAIRYAVQRVPDGCEANLSRSM